MINLERYQHLVRNDAEKQRPIKYLAPWQSDALYGLTRIGLHYADLTRLATETIYEPQRSNTHELTDERKAEIREEAGKLMYEFTALMNVLGIKLPDLMMDWVVETHDEPGVVLPPRKKRSRKKEAQPTTATQEILL